MPSKRPHTKTRHGCKKCRERRVRCDLQRPRCGNCIKRKVECPYLRDAGPEALAGHQIVPSPSLAPGYPVNVDLQLMHYWSTKTCLTVSDDPRSLPIWRDVVPEMAFEYEFLLHGLLALAALHRCRDPVVEGAERAKLVALGRHHKQLALASYIPLLRNSADDNCNPLFAFSVLLGSMCYAMLEHDEEDGCAENLLDSLYNISTLLSGAVALAYKHRDALRAGVLFPMLGMELQPCDIEDLPHGLRESLLSIQQAAESGSPDLPSADKAICLSSMRWLGLFYHPASEEAGLRTTNVAAMTAWPILCGRKLTELISSRDTLALVVLAHYGAIVHIHRRMWFFNGLGARIVAAVRREVGVTALAYVDWPSRTVEAVSPF